LSTARATSRLSSSSPTATPTRSRTLSSATTSTTSATSVMTSELRVSESRHRLTTSPVGSLSADATSASVTVTTATSSTAAASPVANQTSGAQHITTHRTSQADQTSSVYSLSVSQHRTSSSEIPTNHSRQAYVTDGEATTVRTSTVLTSPPTLPVSATSAPDVAFTSSAAVTKTRAEINVTLSESTATHDRLTQPVRDASTTVNYTATTYISGIQSNYDDGMYCTLR